MRKVTRRLIEAAGHRVAGEAATADEGLELIRRVEPDLVLLDVVLPDGCGIDVARTLHDEGSSTRILLISSYGREEMAETAEEAGALGFVPKTELTVEAISQIAAPAA